MHKKFAAFAASTIGLVILDQLVKLWVRTAAQGVEGRTVAVWLPNIFELKLVFNKGVAFGMAQGKGVFLTPVALVIAGFAVYYSFKSKKEPISHHIVMALLAAGAVGNLIDRLAFGKVTDMFWARFIDFPVFNVADVCITFAGAAFVLAGVSEIFKKKSPEPQISESPAPATSENNQE